jgi:hypothetical protein
MLIRNGRILLACTVLAGSMGCAGAALAQTSASTLSEDQGATTGLGSSHRFATAQAASAHCPNDTVVWSAGKKLSYVLPDSAKYGHGGGFYACKMEADSAGFHPSHQS